jgi:hypothetical protein
MSIARDEAEDLISPSIREKLRSSIIDAFQDYNGLDLSLRLTLSATTRANFINDRMCYHVRNKMDQISGIDFVKRRGRTHLIILGVKDALEVKFKKLDYNRRPRNVPTAEASEFLEQVQLEFPGMLHPITNLVAGYQLNATRTGIKGIFVVCPLGSHNHWEIEIPLTAVAPIPLVSTLASADQEVEPPPKKVVPKANIVRNMSKEE